MSLFYTLTKVGASPDPERPDRLSDYVIGKGTP